MWPRKRKSSTSKQITGDQGEEIAKKHLQKQGLKFIRQNFHCKMGEIDLIMQDGEDLVFVEVRFRATTHHGSAIETVDFHKQQKLRKAAEAYLQLNYRNNPPPCRFDVIGLNAQQTIEWIKNAF